MTGKLIGVLLPKATLHVYGGLAGEMECLNPIDFIYRQKTIVGLHLTTWIFGGLVPYDQVWRMGANWATPVTLDSPGRIGDLAVRRGERGRRPTRCW